MKPIGKYEVIAEIGTGGMGTIYRARDQVLDREVALKVLRTDADLDPELKERFYREARACARLTHPNIITVYDLGEAGSDVYIAMELLSGNDLRKVLQENRSFTMSERVDLMAQVAEALQHAHGQQLVHRDIKPSNIFLCDDHRAKVLDFGIARMPTSNLTMAGKVLGSPNYMAPEQIRGGKCDTRSDLFSAAIVFCEFLVRSHPFQDDFIPRRIVASAPDNLRAKDPEVPEALQALLFKALEKDPEKRIQTAGEFAAGLRAILDTLPASPPAHLVAATVIPDPAPIPVAPPPAPVESPAAEDPAEHRLAEFLRVVGDFDEGIDKRDTGAARAALEKMRQLAVGDSRFTLAVSDCEARLNTLPAAPPSAPIPPPVPEAPILAPPPAPRAAKPPELPVPARKVEPARPPQATPPSPNKNLTLVATLAGIVVLLGIFFWLKTRGAGGSSGAVQLEPSVATATVSSASADLLDSSTASGKRLNVLQQGQSVNVIAIPGARDRDYTRVQPMAGDKPQQSGFVRTADLGNWSGKEADGAYSIIELFAPADSAGESELSAQAEKWNDFIARFPSSPRIAAASLESARLEIALATRAKAAGKPEGEWQPHFDKAKNALVRVTGNPEMESQAAQMRSQLPQSGSPPPPTPPVPPQALSPERILRTRVSPLWEDGKYLQAMQLVDQILATSPKHEEALFWKKKIRASQEAEARAQ